MKQKLLYLLVAWFLCIGNAMADNIVINDVTVPKGGMVPLPVGYSFTSTTDKVGFTFCLELPTGLSLVLDSDDDPVYDKDASISKFNIIYTEGNFAGQPSNATTTISGTSGTLLTLQLSADNSVETGSVQVVQVTKCTFQQREDGVVTDINIPDFSFNVIIGEADDGRIHFDETSASLPAYTAGEKGDVTMKRSIRAGQWSTIVLPFMLTKAKAEAAFGSDVQLAEFSGFEVDYGDDEENVTPLGITINFTNYAMSARKGMTGGKPFLIKTSQDIESFEADDVTLVGDITDVEKSDEYETPGKFTGSFVKTKVPADGLFISDNKFWYSVGKTNIKAFRCWFELGAVLGSETDFGARVFLNVIDEEVTGIGKSPKTYAPTEPEQTEKYYDLQGRRIAKPSKGLYIRKGRTGIWKSPKM